MHQTGPHFLAHERLAIMDPNSGDQPLFNEDRTIVVTVNGEVYNYEALLKHIREKSPNKKFATQSDCEARGRGKGQSLARLHGACGCYTPAHLPPARMRWYTPA